MKSFLLGLCLAASLVWAAWAGAAAQMMSVQVREGQLRGQPSFLAAVLATLPYGSQVQVIEEQGGWRKVGAGQTTGWMHLSALSEKKIELKPGAGQVQGGASREELALAGKGFNKDVEADFKAKNREANFAAVDQMEQSHLMGEAQLAEFLQEGGVTPPAGGAR